MAYIGRDVYKVYVDNEPRGPHWDLLSDAEDYMASRIDTFYTIEYMDIRIHRVYTEVPD